MRRGAPLLICSALAAVSACGGNSEDDVREVAKSFAEVNSTSQACEAVHPIYRSELEQEGGTCAEGLDRAGLPVAQTKLGDVQVEGDRATVAARGKSRGVSFDGKYLLRKDDGGWKVIDVDLGLIGLPR